MHKLSLSTLYKQLSLVKKQRKKRSALRVRILNLGAGGRTRTGTELPPSHFECDTSAYSITPAFLL